MTMAMLRAAGREFDVDAFLERYPRIHADNVWHRGEARGDAKARIDSGCSAHIAESDSTTAVLKRLRAPIKTGCSHISVMTRVRA